MALLVDLLQGLFSDGRIVHRERPGSRVDDPEALRNLLEAAFEDHRLDVAGPPIAFDFASALKAAELVQKASWFLINRLEPVEEMERGLLMTGSPRTASEHLSSDLTLRFLPQIHRRSRSMASDDRLSSLLGEILIRWPLSGVLSDVEAGPKEIGDLGNHPGIWMLYAERLAILEKPAWVPPEPALGYVELVFQGLGKGRSPLLRQASFEAVAHDSMKPESRGKFGG